METVFRRASTRAGFWGVCFDITPLCILGTMFLGVRVDIPGTTTSSARSGGDFSGVWGVGIEAVHLLALNSAEQFRR